MAASTATTIHVAGPILPQCNIGAASAYVTLGECQDGATIKIMPKKKGVYADGGGGPGGEPIEELLKNAICEVRFKLTPYGGTYLNKLRAISLATASEGILPLPGTLYGAGGFFPGLYLPLLGGTGANEPDGPYWFPFTRVEMPGDVNYNTDETTPEFLFRGILYYDPSTSTSIAGKTLYARTAPS